ncbi:MAG: DUF5685 family protein [Lachnospiraceae bacterium]
MKGRKTLFGYIILNKPEIKFKEFDIYRSYYCGLCKELKKSSGNFSRFLLSYDMTFIYILLTSLYEPKTTVVRERCGLNPAKKQLILRNEIGEYIADMSTIMSYYKCRDDWKDERKLNAKVLLEIIKRKNKNLSKKYQKKVKNISYWMKKIDEGEKKNNQNIDEMAGYFGQIMAELFAYKEDEWQQSLRKMGFFLGKFIYLMDAYDDFFEDLEKGNYNPFSEMSGEENFDERVGKILLMMMAECTRVFEQLPIIENVELLRNILYAGVWVKYEQVKNRENKEK